MSEPNKIYIIMVMEKLGSTQPGIFPDFGCVRLPGWYASKEAAMQVVKENCCDIWECCYDYALIEEVNEGLYNPAERGQRWWFQYHPNTERYKEIKEPESAQHYAGFTIG